MTEKKAKLRTGLKTDRQYLDVIWVDNVVEDGDLWAIVIDEDGDIHRASIYDLTVEDPF